MAETFENKYEEFASNPEFSAAFGSKTEFEDFIKENDDADVLLKDAYGIDISSLKKKDEAENFTFQSPSVGETSEVPEMAEMPSMGAQIGVEPKQEDPRLKTLRSSLQDNIERIQNNQSPFGAFIEIQKLSKNADYQAFKNSGKLDDLLGQLNETFQNTFLSNPSYASSFNTPKSKQDLENIGIGVEIPSLAKKPVQTELGAIASMATEPLQEELPPLSPEFVRKQEIEARLYSGGDIAQRGKPGYRIEQEAEAKEQADEYRKKASEPKLEQAYAYDEMGRRIEGSESGMENADKEIQPLTNDLRDYAYMIKQKPSDDMDQDQDKKFRETLANKIYDKVKPNIVERIKSEIVDNFDSDKEGVFFKRDIDGY